MSGITPPLAIDVNSREVQNIPLEGETNYEYDVSNNLIKETTVLRNGFKYQIEYEYDGSNNLIKQIVTRL